MFIDEYLEIKKRSLQTQTRNNNLQLFLMQDIGISIQTNLRSMMEQIKEDKEFEKEVL